MKIHTNLTATDMQLALDGSGIPDARLIMTEKNSRSRARRFDVYFDADPMKGRRQSTHVHDGRPVTGISWDEWGMFINALFLLDPDARVGQYRGREFFRDVTDYRFDNLAWEDRHPTHKWAYAGNDAHECVQCGAIRYSSARPTGY